MFSDSWMEFSVEKRMPARGTPTGFPPAFGAAPPPRTRKGIASLRRSPVRCSPPAALRTASSSQRKLRASPRAVTVCYPRDLDKQEGRLRRIPSLETPSLRVRLPARIRNAAPPSVGERGADFGKTGRGNRPRNALRSKSLSPPPVPRWGKRAKSRFSLQDHFNQPERKNHGKNHS